MDRDGLAGYEDRQTDLCAILVFSSLLVLALDYICIVFSTGLPPADFGNQKGKLHLLCCFIPNFKPWRECDCNFPDTSIP